MLSFFRSSTLPSNFLSVWVDGYYWYPDRSQADTSSAWFLNAIPTDYHSSLPNQNSSASPTYMSDLLKTCCLETEWHYTRKKYDRILHQVLELEEHMGIMKRWTPTTQEYTETVCYISEWWYHQALNNLQRLVTQQLFELHRLNLSGICQCFFLLVVFHADYWFRV